MDPRRRSPAMTCRRTPRCRPVACLWGRSHRKGPRGQSFRQKRKHVHSVPVVAWKNCCPSGSTAGSHRSTCHSTREAAVLPGFARQTRSSIQSGDYRPWPHDGELVDNRAIGRATNDGRETPKCRPGESLQRPNRSRRRAPPPSGRCHRRSNAGFAGPGLRCWLQLRPRRISPPRREARQAPRTLAVCESALVARYSLWIPRACIRRCRHKPTWQRSIGSPLAA